MIKDKSNNLLIRAQESAAAGRLSEARVLADSACESDQNNIDAWLLLGNLNGQMQAFDDAILSFQRAVALDSLNPAACAGLTNALYAAGRLDEAVPVCMKLVGIQPDIAGNWNLLATLHGMLGNYEDSARCLRQVTELAPTDALAHRSLGYIAQSQNRLDEALEHYKRAVQCQPGFADAHNDIGIIVQESGNLKAAANHFRTALKIRPDYIEALMNLGNVLLAQHDLKGAQEHFESILAIDANHLKALSALGSVQLERGVTREARAMFDKALSLDPAFEDAIVMMARLHERQGEHDEALSLLRPLIDRGDNSDAIIAFALLSHHVHMEDRAIELIERALGNTSLLSKHKTEMHFTLGRLYDKKGEYDLAFRNFDSGNKQKHVSYRLSDHTHLITSLIETYSREQLPKMAQAMSVNRQPVFIVGMPRSGTSLAEQILSAHPDVQAAGELTTLNRLAAHLHASYNLVMAYPQGALSLSAENASDMAREYLADLPVEGEEKAFFTDKMPHNFLHLGLIQQLFPDARVIHCVRDPRDTCFSCFSYDFNGEHGYAYDLETLGKYYLQYRRLMDHWQSVLSIPIYTLDYEQLIVDQEEGIRDLVEFCGLDWDERCLDFHASSRFVLTSSYDQVRRPIYSSSVGRWRNYGPYIQPLLDALRL